MGPSPDITCKPDGPYLVTDLADLRRSDGSSLPTRTVVALCRCGGSANKPFCDGTHQRNGFSGARISRPSDGPTDYRAPRITIHDDRSLCAHAGRCTDGLPSVFRYASEPWIDAEGAGVDEIIETIRQCPSGALKYSVAGAAPAHQQADSPAVVVSKNGPYEVSGPVAFSDPASGQSRSGGPYTLCRCGGSKNKPFCDGSHWDNGFADDSN